MTKGLDGIILGGGPSLDLVTQEQLDRFPCITMAVNQHAWMEGLWPDHVVFVDGIERLRNRDEAHFKACQEIMEEPGIVKWVRKRFNTDAEPDTRDANNINFFNSGFNMKASEYFTSKYIYIGEHQTEDRSEDEPGLLLFHTSSFFPTFRLMYDLGVRRIFLLGVDFLEPTTARFPFISEMMRPLLCEFKKAELEIINCTRGSLLELFVNQDFPTKNMPATQDEVAQCVY